MRKVKIIQGDCLEAMARLPDNSVDSVCTDPPYGLEFMGKDWDKFGRDTGNGYTEKPRWSKGDHGRQSGSGPNFYTAGAPYQEWCESWARECLRVLKPGGHMLAFGGTRTYHRLACAIEDAGFEIRDSLHWIYGTGFPKSLNVSKAIDKAAGAEREIVAVRRKLESYGPNEVFGSGPDHGGRQAITTPATAAAAAWDGWGTALKPSFEPVVVARKPAGERAILAEIGSHLSSTPPNSPDEDAPPSPAHEPIVLARKPLISTVAGNVLEHGTGALNIDASRVGTTKDTPASPRRAPQGPAYSDLGNDPATGSGWDKNTGRWPPNILLTHDPACVPAGTRQVRGSHDQGKTIRQRGQSSWYTTGEQDDAGTGYSDQHCMETMDAFDCADGCPVAELDAQSGKSKSGEFREDRGKGGIWHEGDGVPCGPQYGDTGGASRFFPVFRYQANDCAPGCPVAELDAQSGITKSSGGSGIASMISRGANVYAGKLDQEVPGANLGGLGDVGGASRFFPVFRYQAKAPKSERPKLDGVASHPTVKPLALMRWLVTLVTPPGGLVLDPFAGTGTTGQACQLEGFRCILIERDGDYVKLIRERIE